MSQFYVFPIDYATNPSVGSTGVAPPPTNATLIGGVNPSNQLTALKTDASGYLLVDVATFGPSPLSVTQGTVPWVDNVTQFGGNNVVTGTGASGLGIPRVTVSSDSNILATQSGTWNINNISGTVSLPTGASTAANQATEITSLATIVTNTNNLSYTQGAATSGQLANLILGACTTAAPTYVTGNSYPLSLTTAGAVRVDASGSTQPVSGTVTVLQGTTPWADNISQFGGSVVVTGTGASGAGIPRVTVSNDSNILATQSGTWNINNISGTVSLPTGASTAANQATEITSLATIVTNTNNLSLAQGSTTSGQAGNLVLVATTTAAPTYVTATSNPLSQTTAGALRVDGSGVTQPVSFSGGSGASVAIAGTVSANAPVYNVYSSTNITTAAYVQLVASTSNVINTIHIFDSSGQAMIFATGGSGSEVISLYVPPGGDTYTLTIPAGTRIAYKALTANATSGYLLMSFLE